MSLAARRRAVAEAEANLVDASERLRLAWSGLKQEGSAALTPGRVVVGGLLSGYFGGMLGGATAARRADGPREGGDGVSLILALLQLGSTLLPHVLPSLAPAFRAGASAGAARPPETSAAAQPGDRA